MKKIWRLKISLNCPFYKDLITQSQRWELNLFHLEGIAPAGDELGWLEEPEQDEDDEEDQHLCETTIFDV